MAQIPDITLSPTEPAARQVMRESLLADLDARIASAGGVADYVYTTPRADLDRMLRRATLVSEDARVLPDEDAIAHAAGERVVAATRMLETEARCRDLVAQDAVNSRGKLPYELPDDLHVVTQEALAARLSYHETKLAEPDYVHGAGFDHLHASAVDSRHLLAQQVDAYDRGLEVVPSQYTQFQLGQKLHHRITRSVMVAQENHRPGWEVEEIAGRLVEHEDYLKEAVDEYREFRRVVPVAADHGIYPDDVTQYQRPDWDRAARVVDSAVDQAVGQQQAVHTPAAARDVIMPGGNVTLRTPARDAYLDARAQAGAVGMTLADPRMQQALELARLEQGRTQLAGSLPDGYEPDRKPPVSRLRDRAEWQRHQPAADALAINAAEQKLLRTELGPDSDQRARRALELVETREQILAQTPELQRRAVEEEIARDPEWLTDTLGPRPEVGAARWQALAGELAANRLRFAVADDADPGIRPEQSVLAGKVAMFRAQAAIEQSLSVTPALGLWDVDAAMNQNRKYIKAEKRVAIVVLGFSLVGALAFTLWAGPVLATWTITGHWVRLPYGRALIVTIGTVFAVAHATRHWPPLVRQAAAVHLQWWLAITLLLASEISVATGILRWLDRIASQPVADRRWWQLKGISPRTYGRTHTLAPLLVERRQPDQIVVGIHQGRRLAVQKNVHLLVIAPPRSGKTAGIIIPALLDHTGPVVSTSVRTDVRDRTVTRRRELGDVFQWDPFTLSGDTDFYDPIHGCKDWGHALRVARWFTGAVSLSTGGSQDYFNEEAENLLAPLIYAAAWQPNGSIISVFDWLERKDPNDATSLLDQVGRAHPNQPTVQRACAAAIAKLEGTFAYNERQLDGLIGTARVFLKVYGNPAARATAETWRAKDAGRRIITPEAVFGKRPDGLEPANTLYLIADRDDQKQLAPIIVMMLSEMVYYLDQQYNRRRELPISAMFALDEAAQIAPLQDINRIMSASLPNSRFITVWHSVSQIQDRYGAEAAREILAASQAKIYLGSNTDGETVTEVNRLVGQLAGDQTFNPEIQTAQALQRLGEEQGILVHTQYPPALFKQRRYYKDPTLGRMADAPDTAALAGVPAQIVGVA